MNRYTEFVTPVALTIAGSDPSGGAGIQADLKTFHRMEAYGEAVITLITVQNTVSVDRVEILAADLVRQQVDSVVRDIPPKAAKTGALGSAEIVQTIAEAAQNWTFPLVVDPVMFSSKGSPLLDRAGHEAMVELLIPRATLLTPNLAEASGLAGFSVTDVASMRRAAETIAARGPKNVLVKGGHLLGEAVDILFADGHMHEFAAQRIPNLAGVKYSNPDLGTYLLGKRLDDKRKQLDQELDRLRQELKDYKPDSDVFKETNENMLKKAMEQLSVILAGATGNDSGICSIRLSRMELAI